MYILMVHSSCFLFVWMLFVILLTDWLVGWLSFFYYYYFYFWEPFLISETKPCIQQYRVTRSWLDFYQLYPWRLFSQMRPSYNWWWQTIPRLSLHGYNMRHLLPDACSSEPMSSCYMKSSRRHNLISGFLRIKNEYQST